jgi:hypothetical protein
MYQIRGSERSFLALELQNANHQACFIKTKQDIGQGENIVAMLNGDLDNFGGVTKIPLGDKVDLGLVRGR